ncbi:MAG: hypothetical protein ACP5T3_01735 [Candidatus Micrarchaeia archaeon]
MSDEVGCMALKDIIDKINEEARQKAEEISRSASEEAKEIIASAKKQAHEKAKEIEKASRAEQEALRKEKLQGIAAEESEIIDKAFDEAVEKATALALAKLKKLVERHMQEMAAQAISQFAKAVPADETIATAGSEYEKLLKNAGIEYRRGKAQELVLSSKDNSISMRVSAEALARSYKDIVEGLVVKELRQKTNTIR